METPDSMRGQIHVRLEPSRGERNKEESLSFGLFKLHNFETAMRASALFFHISS
jgi:hypothetical protein